MANRNAGARRYLREIRSWLPCAGKLRRGSLERIGNILDEFLEEEPGADYGRIVERFGKPQQIAAAYVDEMETGELLNNLRVRRKVVRIILTTATLMITLWMGMIVTEIIDNHNQMNGYFEVEIQEIQNPVYD